MAVQVLDKGGNAVDAAVAVGFALAVVHPEAGNLGGGGFMVIRLKDGTTQALDYRETAPGRATRDMYLDASGNPTEKSITGAMSRKIWNFCNGGGRGRRAPRVGGCATRVR